MSRSPLHGETTQRMAVLPVWRDTPMFTDVERASSRLAASLTTLPDPRTQALDDEAAAT